MKDNQFNLYGLLERLSTEQLDEMLQTELQKEAVDENAVRVILRVLREREAEMPVEVDGAAEQAWAQYVEETSLAQPHVKKWGWAWRVAMAAIVVGAVLLIAPATANAERIQGMLIRWTDSVLEFFDPNDKETNSVEYEFKTDNPGLQQVYDAVVELGVTDPVVPMWIPEGYELVEIKKRETDRKKNYLFSFSNGNGDIVFEINSYDENTHRTYQKDEREVSYYERDNVVHCIVRNNDFWTAVWTRENIECFVIVGSQKEDLLKILRSIYDGGV